ncbi:hypothetical protein [Nocardia altamirensis]|uniref:hypothetical protein n=1 Tax=Nocardia altamirensis TaxID=472158 RepID=UPI00084035BD|nr:hypothetical protein [Nocardia altamirensis]
MSVEQPKIRESRQRAAARRAPWIVLAVAACIALLAPLSLTFTDACDYLECRKEMAPIALVVSYLGAIFTLLVAWVMIDPRAPHGRHRVIGALIALIGVFVSSWIGWQVADFVSYDDRPLLHRESRAIKTALGRMPGVREVSTAAPSQGPFSAVVMLTEEATLAQAKAVIEAFREQTTAAPDFLPWEYDIKVRQGVAESSFTTGKSGLDSATDRLALWFALRQAFPQDEVKWTYHTWDYYEYKSSDQRRRPDTAVGGISLKLVNANDFAAVTESYRRLMRDFPQFSEAFWEVGPAAHGSGSLRVNNRYPTEPELADWNQRNELNRPYPYHLCIPYPYPLNCGPYR